MLHKTLFLLFILLNSTFALTLQEAIEKTLFFYDTIQEQEFLLQESKINFQKQKSSFYPSLNLNYTAYKSDQLRESGKGESSNFGGNIQYNLFNGLSDSFNLSSAKSTYEAQFHQLQSTKQDTILLVKNAYIDALRQIQNVLVSEESQKLLQEQKRQSIEFHKAGLIPKNDVLKVEVELNNATQTLLAAKSTLKFLIKTLEIYTKTPLTPTELIDLPLHKTTLEYSFLQDLMLKNNSQLHFLDQIIQSKDYIIKSNKGNFLPKINLTGKYSSSADHYNILTKTQKDGVTLEFQVSLNLFNGFSDKYQLESSKANKLAFQSQKAALIEKLKLELFKVLQSYELALNAYELSLTALKQAEENYRISNNRYQERIESTSNLLDAQLLLTQAKSNVVLNRYSILQSLAEIERITQTQNLSEATTN